MRTILIFISVLFATAEPVFAKTVCNTKELLRKNCQLKSDGIKVGLSDRKIRFTNAPWTSIRDFPAHEKITHWEDVRLERIKDRTFLHLKVWQRVEKELDMEELYWRVLEFKERSLPLQVQKPIGKRSGEKISDPIQSTKLILVDGKVLWQIKNEKGELGDGI